MREDYIILFKQEGFHPDFLTTNEHGTDHWLYRDARFFHELAQTTPDVPSMFDLVRQRIASHEGKQLEARFPYNIWQRGYGVCDRQSWVLCEIAYQKGYETQIVYLMNPETGESPHTICELRRKNEVWFADPLGGVLLGQSVESVVEDDSLLRKFWSEKPEWLEGIKHCRFWIPSYPQDYCARIKYQKEPRLGEDPFLRGERYLDIGGTLKFPISYWFYPLRVLVYELGNPVKEDI